MKSKKPLQALSAVAAAVLAASMLSGCGPGEPATPTPTSSKTGLFESDAEAFAAAEATYRAYVDAANHTDLSDAATFDPVYAWLTGTALASEKESFTFYSAEKLRRTGDTSFDTFSPLSVENGQVIVNLCLDVSDVDLLDQTGASVIPPDRLSRRALKVTVTPGDTETHLLIASNHQPESFSC